MGRSHVEHEITLSVGPDVAVPDLHGLPGVRDVSVETVQLDAEYWDTSDLVLLRNRITLRRRTGGPDEGWHLKRPDAGDDRRRTELHAPVGSAGTVPAVLRREVQAVLRGRRLAPVATLTTRRTFHRLVGQDARVLAEVCDDVVVGRVDDAVLAAVDGPGEQRWREWEVELVDGPPEVLDDASDVLLAAGAVPADHPSKVGRVLAGALPEGRPASSGLGPRRAGTVVWEYLAAHVAALQVADPLVRSDEPEGVHDMRVAARRLRSALTTFRPLLDRDAVEPLRVELRELGRVLGAARDAQVQRDRLGALLAGLDGELVVGPVAARLERELGGAYRAAHRDAVRVLSSPRYFRLLDDLDRLLADPPWTRRARRRADRVLPRRVRSAHRDVVAAVERAETAPSASREVALHEVRKAAKRARYAAEAMTPRLGPAAERYATGMEAVQDALGERRDAVVARGLVRDQGMRAHLAGENGFTWGLLHGLDQMAAEQAERDFLEAWAAAGSARRRRWLR